MMKTKTKRLAVTTLILTIMIGVVAVFYFFYINHEGKTDTGIKEVKINESVKGDEANQVDSSGPREYISKYYQEKDRFNAIGASWEELNASDKDINIYIRVKDSGEESEWFEVYKDIVQKEGKTTYYTAESPVLVRGDEYQYKVVFRKAENEIKNLKFSIINTMGTVYTRFFDKVKNLLNREANAAAWNPANIISRNEWGGSAVNVSSTLWPPRHAEKSSKFIVHHTAGVNKSCSSTSLTESKQDVKAIWSFHTYGRDWGDIGYNYLVDSCGRIFEGRLGGNNVIAGHAAPYNYWDKNSKDGVIDEASIGISVMGNYSDYSPTSAIIENLGRIIGYKSYINGIKPTGSATFKDKTTGNIAGHRDYVSTACPGSKLQSKLSNIRNAALAHKILYIDSYGDYNNVADNIYLSKARVTMDDVNTPSPDDYVLADNPAIGEKITILSAFKNTSQSVATLKNVKIIGIFDNGSEFVIGKTPTFTINPSETKALPDALYSINSSRVQTYKITYEIQISGPGGSNITFEKEPKIASSSSFKYPSIKPHFPVIRLTAGPSVSPTNPVVNSSATLEYSLKNYDSRPTALRNLYLAIDDGSNITKSPIVSSAEFSPNASFNYSEQTTFKTGGNNVLRPFFSYANGSKSQAKNLAGNSVSLAVQVTNAPISPSKIYLNSFKATMEDTSTIDSNDYVLANSPAIGEPINIRATLRNTNSSPVTLTNVRIRGVLDSGKQFTIRSTSSLTLNANSYTAIPIGTYYIASFRVHSFYIDYQINNITRKPTLYPNYSYQKIKAHFPNVKVVKTPVFTPHTILVKDPMHGLYKLKNYDSRPAYLRVIRIAAKTGSSLYHFPGEKEKISPGQVYQYYRGITPTKGGVYSAYAQITYGNGSVSIPASLSITSSYSSFKVYTEVATLNGITIPATSGRVAREQHLNLIASESASHHYSTSPVASSPSWLRNGMAGGAGSFGSYGYPPKAEEKYYITMRWNYTTWYSGALGNASQMYCGSAYSYYSIHYYSSYKYGGEYCVPRTYTKNSSSSLKASHWKRRVVVTNPANGRKVVVSVLESGPAIWTGRAAGLSPEAMYALGISSSTNNNNPLKYYWAADQSMSLGRIK